MGIERDKFRDTTRVEDLKKADQKVEKLNRTQTSDYAGYLTIEDGENKFRIYPPHPNKDNHPFVQAKQLWWLPWVYEQKDDDGNVIKDKKGNPKMQDGKKRIFDARIHSKAGVDVVSEYIDFYKKMCEDAGMSEDEVTEAMLPIYGSYQKKIQGIVGKPGWVIYADEHNNAGGKEFGRLEIGKAVKYRLNDIIARESDDEPVGTVSQNPFTDLDDGRLLIVTYNGDAKKAADYYKTEIDSSFDKKTKQVNLVPLSDEELETFSKYPSLHSLFVDVYTSEDFEYAVTGLKLFDDKEELGVFEHEEWNEKVAKMAELYPDPDDDDEEKPEEEKPEETEGDGNMNDGGPEYSGGDDEKKEEEEPPEEVDEVDDGIPPELEGDDYDDMERNDLKIFIRDNAIPIVVKKSMTDDAIRDLIRKHVAELEGGGDTKAEKPAKSTLKDKYS